MDLIQDELKDRLGDSLQFNVLMKEHTTMGVGGIADYFFIAQNIEDIVSAANEAQKFGIPFVVIGSGSNIIVSDTGFKGLVIHNRSSNIVINAERGEVIADSGLIVSRLLNQAVSHNMGGIEFLAGVPGTLGGAIYGNAGSSTAYIGNYVKSLTMLDLSGGELKVIKRPHDWMEFTYRSTKLKRMSPESFKPIILTAHLRLPQKRNDEIIKSIQEHLKLRQSKQPYGEKSAGSFFKNPGKLPEQAAGYLLDKSGAKKLKIGGAAISRKHANFVINQKDAQASDIKKIAESAKKLVFENYDVVLEEEVEYIGEW